MKRQKNQMKKISALALASMLILTGCGGKTNEQGGGEEEVKVLKSKIVHQC